MSQVHSVWSASRLPWCQVPKKRAVERRGFYCHAALVLLTLIGYHSTVLRAELPAHLRYQLLEEQSRGYYIASIKVDTGLSQIYNSTAVSHTRFQFLVQPTVNVSLGQVSGVLETKGRVNRDTLCPGEELCEVILDIAIHRTGFFHILKVTLEIQDLNDITPWFTQPVFEHSILESAAVGTSIVISAAKDDDSPEYGVTGYRLEFEYNTFRLSVVTKLDGTSEVKVVLQEALDREYMDRYSLRLIAYDGGNPPNEGYIDVRVTVSDSNDNPPVFENSTYSVSVQENLERGTTVIRVRAFDPDEGLNGDIIYGLSTYSQDMYGQMFSVQGSSGHVVAIGHLDYESITKYTLSVTARDRGPNPIQAETILTVNLVDQNDCVPHVSVNTLLASDTDIAEVEENAANETFVAHVSVKDEDSDQNGQVTCLLASPHFNLVQMFEKEYKIVTRASLDREVTARYEIVLQCEDKGNPKNEVDKKITIHVGDENDNYPVFDREVYNVSVLENQLLNVTVCQVHASDRDQAANAAILYSIPQSLSSTLVINQFTGIIQTIRAFDREVASQVQFEISARDQGTPRKSATATVIINIGDVNDEPPRFLQDIYLFSILEGPLDDRNVGIVQAFDADKFPNNQCRYSLAPGNESWKFVIDSDAGIIHAQYDIDREEQNEYHLIVRAVDKRRPSLSSLAQVIITIDDINDNTPYVTYPTGSNTTIAMSNLVPKGYLATKILANDLDVGDNGRLRYVIIKGNKSNAFVLNESTGYITTADTVSHINYERFELLVEVSDHGSPLQSTTTLVTLIVDSSILYLTQMDEDHILDHTKLVIIISLAITSAILTVILITAIVCIRRKEMDKRKAKQHQARMEGLKMLNTPPPPQHPVAVGTNLGSPRVGEVGVGHSKTASIRNSGRNPSILRNGGSTLPRWPGDRNDKQVLDIPVWHKTTTKVPPHSPMTSPESGDLDTDASADGSHTTDSGRGHSDVGETKCDVISTAKEKYPDINPHGYKVAPHKTPMRTFSKSPPKHTSKNSSSEVTPLEVLYQLQQRGHPVKAEELRHQENDLYHCDPIRTRAYYRDFPVFNANTSSVQLQLPPPPPQYHDNTGPATVTKAPPPPRYHPADMAKLLDSNNSTFV